MDNEKLVCRCCKVTVGDIKEAFDNGAKLFEEIQEVTSASSCCGSCSDEVQEIISELSK